eukprot:COSAG05_NODE_277_length_12336_cov_419.763668_3_plen_103_part_00
MNISDPASPVAIWTGTDGQQNLTRLGGVSGVATFVRGSSLYAAAHDDNGVQLLSLAECIVVEPTIVTLENTSNIPQAVSDNAGFSGSFSSSASSYWSGSQEG